MTKRRREKQSNPATAVDLFCGAGGLTRGLLDAGIAVAAGYDVDEACRYPYTHNNSPATFQKKSVTELTGKQLARYYPKGHVRVLVGCAPCVTFSQYTQGVDPERDPKWSLLRDFARLVRELKPDIVSMENVPGLQRHSVFTDFLKTLDDQGFHYPEDAEARIVYCPDYGIPQRRTRLVVVASRLGPISLVPRTHRPHRYRTVSDALRSLPALKSGSMAPHDPMHRSSKLSALNLRRIRKSIPGGTWDDWPSELVADCHKSTTGDGYGAVYGRMTWHEPAPTITTQFHGFGSGRFGHPEQDRALSLREGALLQSFPKSYAFVKPGGKYHFTKIGRLIGNAVPVRLGAIIGRTIAGHVEHYAR